MTITKQIAVLPGSTIGSDIIREPINLLKNKRKELSNNYEFLYEIVGNPAYDITGRTLPPEAIKLCKSSDAVLLGLIIEPESLLDEILSGRQKSTRSRLNTSLGLFSSHHPFSLFPGLIESSPIKQPLLNDVNCLLIKDLTGGIYTGEKMRKRNGDEAVDISSYSRNDIKRIAVSAFREALGRRNKLSLIHKSSSLEYSRLWVEVIQNIAPDYPEVQLEILEVETAVNRMILEGKNFDVILTDNLFGNHILSVMESIHPDPQLLPAASYGFSSCIYGSAYESVDLLNIRKASLTISSFLSIAMMLDYFEDKEFAGKIRYSVSILFQEKTSDFLEKQDPSVIGDAICANI